MWVLWAGEGLWADTWVRPYVWVRRPPFKGRSAMYGRSAPVCASWSLLRQSDAAPDAGPGAEAARVLRTDLVVEGSQDACDDVEVTRARVGPVEDVAGGRGEEDLDVRVRCFVHMIGESNLRGFYAKCRRGHLQSGFSPSWRLLLTWTSHKGAGVRRGLSVPGGVLRAICPRRIA